MRWDIINNVVTIFSRVPIEKVLVHKPYQEERPLTLPSRATAMSPAPLALEDGNKDPEWMEQLEEQADVRDQSLDGEEEARLVEAPSEYAGFSQISAAGKACIPCSNDHFSTVAGELAEAIRFAREGGVTHPEVMLRITDAEDQLNALERIDGAPIKVQKLPQDEKKLMNDMIKSSRHMRHLLKDISTVEDLESLAAHAQNERSKYRTKLFRLQMSRLTPGQMQKIKEKAAEVKSQ